MVTFATNHSAAVRSGGTRQLIAHLGRELFSGDLGDLFNDTDSIDINYNPVYDIGCGDDSHNKSKKHIESTH